MDVAAEFFDALETRSADERWAGQLGLLRAQLAHARAHAAAYAPLLAEVDIARIHAPADLALLPVVRKHELLARQRAAIESGGDPFGGFAAVGWRGLVKPSGVQRVFQSPGPLYEPQGAHDGWRMQRAMFAAGFRAGDLLHNAFSYHLTPAGAMMEAGALALGCAVLPAGVGNTELQLQAALELKPHGYVGTPSFLRILAERADVQGLHLPFSKALVSGEAFPGALRDALLARGIAGLQCYATADLGLIAYETPAREGLVADEGVIVEIVRPGTGEPLPEGEVGEVVVTSLNPDYPLIRFGTGDLSAVMPGTSPCGRTGLRLRGWLGRADQSAKVRGMFVHAGQVAQVLAQVAGAGAQRARLVIDGEMANDRMVLQVEHAAPPDGLLDRLATALRDVTKLRGEIEWVPPASLPNDGKVIDDRRSVG